MPASVDRHASALRQDDMLCIIHGRSSAQGSWEGGGSDAATKGGEAAAGPGVSLGG